MNEISIFGSKCRIEIIIICLLFGFIAGGYMLCGCIRPMDKRYEGMEGLSTPQNYNNDGGNMYSWVKQVNNKDMNSLGGNSNTYSVIEGSKTGAMDNLAMFANTKTSPTCASQISGYGGVYCVTPEQREFINSRGGNRSKCSEV